MGKLPKGPVFKSEGAGGVAVGLIAAAMAGLGVPKIVWVIVLAIGAVLLVLAAVGWVRAVRPGSAWTDDLYADLLKTGTAVLKDFEGALRHAATCTTEKELNAIDAFVDRYLLQAQVWMQGASESIGERIGEPTEARFVASPPRRPKPPYIENEREVGIWLHMAGRLDWLLAEIGRNRRDPTLHQRTEC